MDTCNVTHDTHVTVKSPYCPCSRCNICGWELNTCNEHSN